MLPDCSKIPKSECPDVWIRRPRHEWSKSWANIEDPVVPLERNLEGHPSAGRLWERQVEAALWELGREKIPSWECVFVHRNKSNFCQKMWTTKNGWKEAECGSKVKEIDDTSGHWRTHIISWSRVLGMHSAGMQTEWNKYWAVYKAVRITYFCWEQQKITGMGKTSSTNRAWSYDMGRTCSKNALNDSVNWQTRKWSNCTKFQSPCLDDDLCKQEELESVVGISQVCSHNFWECLYLARDHLTSCGPWTSLQDQSRNGLRHGMWQTTSKADFVTIVMWKNTEQHCGPGLFQDSDFAGDLGDSKST